MVRLWVVILWVEDRGHQAKRVTLKIEDGCGAYLAYVNDTSVLGSIVEVIHTVKDFSDVFLEELSKLPPKREVEFEIEVLLGTTSAFIAPYHMALKKLKELKV
ncbi:RVP_2 domain-containing protein [Gossypium australe]|uniref:RVP_2 domain-containing protein n=1 Tax=Gossypium australe TaxID=47621 RepID=A0A5B6VMC2_9ROSI|nr:RVP_2 domain-containing protein [Gossypium australe]